MGVLYDQNISKIMSRHTICDTKADVGLYAYFNSHDVH